VLGGLRTAIDMKNVAGQCLLRALQLLIIKEKLKLALEEALPQPKPKCTTAQMQKLLEKFNTHQRQASSENGTST
jgi:hypothetical protein